MSARFDEMYAKTARPSIPPEKLLRAQLMGEFEELPARGQKESAAG